MPPLSTSCKAQGTKIRGHHCVTGNYYNRTTSLAGLWISTIYPYFIMAWWSYTPIIFHIHLRWKESLNNPSSLLFQEFQTTSYFMIFHWTPGCFPHIDVEFTHGSVSTSNCLFTGDLLHFLPTNDCQCSPILLSTNEKHLTSGHKNQHSLAPLTLW